jgi:hypothetical protein
MVREEPLGLSVSYTTPSILAFEGPVTYQEQQHPSIVFPLKFVSLNPDQPFRSNVNRGFLCNNF